MPRSAQRDGITVLTHIESHARDGIFMIDNVAGVVSG